MRGGETRHPLLWGGGGGQGLRSQNVGGGVVLLRWYPGFPRLLMKTFFIL